MEKKEKDQMIDIKEESNRRHRSLSRNFKELEDTCERYFKLSDFDMVCYLSFVLMDLRIK